MTDNSYIKIFYDWIEKKSIKKYYCFYLAFILMLCSLTLAMPNFSTFNPNSDTWDAIILKSKDLTNSLNLYEPSSGIAKKVFRLLVPIIIRITHLNPLGIVILQYIIGYLLILYCYKLSLKILNDAVSSTFIASGIVFLYFGRACFGESSIYEF